MLTRRNILAALILLGTSSPNALYAASKKTSPDWTKGAEEVEEAKFEKAFAVLKGEEDFRKAAFAGDAETLIAMFNKQTNTKYNVDIKFKGKGARNLKFSIDCNRRKDGQWQFTITLKRS